MLLGQLHSECPVTTILFLGKWSPIDSNDNDTMMMETLQMENWSHVRANIINHQGNLYPPLPEILDDDCACDHMRLF